MVHLKGLVSLISHSVLMLSEFEVYPSYGASKRNNESYQSFDFSVKKI